MCNFSCLVSAVEHVVQLHTGWMLGVPSGRLVNLVKNVFEKMGLNSDAYSRKIRLTFNDRGRRSPYLLQ